MENFIVKMDSIYLPAQKPQKSCQDYCLIDEERHLMILSDGCGSSKNTDMGARLLCHSANSVITDNEITAPSIFKQAIIGLSSNICNILDLDLECLDATLIIAHINDKHIKTITYGDGSHIIVGKNGELQELKSFSFDGNAPHYMSYLLNEKREEEYKKSIRYKTITIQSDIIRDMGYSIDSWEDDISKYEIDKLSMFMITSDGIESFFNYKTGEKVPSIDVARELIKIKSKNGEFIKRRVKRMLEDFAKQDIYNSDDLTVCGFIIEENT